MSPIRSSAFGADTGRHPLLYFGGASESAERVAAAYADVQLFWGETLDGVAQRIDRLTVTFQPWHARPDTAEKPDAE